MDDMREIMEDFLVEAFELVEQIDHDLIELESNPEDLELLNRIFRVAHTVKGSSSFLNFDILTKLTHHMEDVLNKARRNELKITPDIMDVVLESVDMMKGLLHGIRDSGNDTDVGIEIGDICKRLTAISEGEAPSAAASEPTPAAPEPVVEAPKEPEPVGDENLSNLSDDEVEAEIERLLKVRKAEDQARRAQKAAAGEAPKPAAPAAPQAPAPSNSAPTPKPAPAKPANKKEDKKVPALSSGASADEQTIRVEVKRLDHLMNLIGELVLGKNRLLKIYDDVEERYEGEKFLEEDGPTRLAAGKPEKGTIQLKAYNEGNHIVVEITDDGKGLDADMLKARSIEKGIITEREADTMSDKEAFGLIFKPGFSTAAKVTNVSGRGVGMDVVKTNIEKLNGIIDIESEVGKGTTMKLKIPLTLAIIQSLLVGAQEEFFAIPLASVLETVRVPIDDIYTIDGKNVLRLRDEVLSLVKLSDIFGVKQVFDGGDQTYVVVIGVAEAKLGIIVDSLVGQEEIVIKSMGDYLQNIPGIAGATIRGDGRVTLIIDVGMMMEMAKDIKVDIKATTRY